jgi:Zinc knuckle
MSKNNDNKKFNGEGVAEFEEFVYNFHVEANKRGCDQHFTWKTEDVKEDKSVPEEVFPYKRMCAAGKEEECAKEKFNETILILDNKYKIQLDDVQAVFVGNLLLKKEHELRTKWQDAKANFELGFDKTVQDLRAACDLHDRKEKLFTDARAQAVSLLVQWLGPSPFGIIQIRLEEVGPKNAFKKLVDDYDAEADTNEYLGTVMSRISNLVFSNSLGGGKVSDHMGYLDKLNNVLVRKGKGINDGLLLNYLIASIKRNKDALALYSKGIEHIFLGNQDRRSAIDLLIRIEHAHETEAEMRGNRTNFAGAQFARVQGAFAGTATTSKDKSNGKRKSQVVEGKEYEGADHGCYRCGSSDHLRKDCKEEVYCKPCNLHTHSEKCCWKLHPEKKPSHFKRSKVGASV